MKKTEAIKNFLSLATSPVAAMYTEEMEVQVNVAQDMGERMGSITDSPYFYKDLNTDEVWRAFRLPSGMNKNYGDSEMSFDLLKHAEAIGMSGWNYIQEKSMWAGFDFDNIITHKAGLTEEQLQEVVNTVIKIPYVTLLKSTSGTGYHVYIHYSESVSTVSRGEHAALAKSLLQAMSVSSGYNFTAAVDCCGAILWCWHRKQEGTDGLSVIKYATEKFDVANIPVNWKDHVTVSKTNKTKSQMSVEALAKSIKSVVLDEMHKDILKWFPKNAQHNWWWDTDLKMLVCHTLDLKELHKDLRLKGYFKTDSSGSSSQNCFCFPAKNGSWIVRRYSRGTKEHDSWGTDDQGWTRVKFNSPPTFISSCVYHGGILDRDDCYNFNNSNVINAILGDLGVPYRIELSLLARDFKIKYSKGKIIITTDFQGTPLNGFIQNKKKYEKVIYYNDANQNSETETILADDEVRHVVSQGMDAGWFVHIGGMWTGEPKSNVSDVIASRNTSLLGAEIRAILGETILAPWELVVEPFQPEYLGGRLWNKYTAKFSVEPDSGTCDTWLTVFEHLGNELDYPVKNDEWCQNNDVKSGAEYLLMWVASMFQKPKQPLPYLFFWSEEENTGKSTFHEALGLLFKDGIGYVRADHALTSIFNNELCGAVLCIIEETDLSKDNSTSERMKDYVTGKSIAIRAMRRDVFLVPNTTHWAQFSNNPNFCLIGNSDTRIISIKVSPIKKVIPKATLFVKLEQEAPAFLNSVLSIKIPSPEGRLGLPCIVTNSKEEIMKMNISLLEQYVSERLFYKSGYKMTYTNFKNNFHIWLMTVDPREKSQYTDRKISKLFKSDNDTIFKGRWKDGNNYLFNASLDSEAEPLKTKYAINESGKIEEICLEV